MSIKNLVFIFIVIFIATTVSVLSLSSSKAESLPTASDSESVDIAIREIPIAKRPKVSVTEANLGEYRPVIVGYGEARSTHELLLTSEIVGRVNLLSEHFHTGKIVPEGTVLAQIESTNYEQALAGAKSTLAQAQLNLLEEERKSKQALNEWERSGLNGQPASELVLRSPQLALVKAKVESAKADVAKAKRDLKNTLIRAPFEALIVTRDVQPGSVLQIGTQIATIYSTEKVEIRVPLSDDQWADMPSQVDLAKDQQSVTIISASGIATWQADIERIERHISSDTRQRAVILSVLNPFKHGTGLYPGTFVRADIKGKLINNLWELPASAVSQEGNLWFVEGSGELRKIKAKRSFDIDENTYVSPLSSEATGIKHIVKRPLSHFKEGMLVQVNGAKN
ncbi:RND family efflux transporter MFP subunit [Alteromonas sp. 76-1]|jgi:RND family efflux transporter MFP subunit|uniref:efflux RND transporter periplasmic adaptor subunit n=1 Tax=Alteromonas sp. 76-1 TaxID=2358187 RepID=UPI000FD17E1D|nr:efflux RND transporter periplasmic adaptor subunit [Alteromonas sp. 76-1]VEL95358.1 RND family efflux transporter MFP subunit [Alteromonas sp. 76-1]